MPKRSAEDEISSLGKKARTASSSSVGRKASVMKTEGTVSPEAQDKQDSLTVSPAMLSEGPPKTLPDPTSIRRRMNPDSLAYRLGVDLIKELEELLTPGMTEMPPFSVRQEIQQRYKVDRRHIYDWFHNKGLRVSSSEKRNEQRAAKLRESRSMPDTRIQRRIRTHSERATAPPPAQNIASNHTLSGSSTPILSGSTPSSSVASNVVSYEAACQPHRQQGYLSHPFGDFDHALFPYPSFLAFSPSQTASHAPYPFHHFPDYQSLPNTEPFKSIDRTSDWISEQQKIPYAPGSFSSPSLDSEDAAKMNASENLDSLWPLGHEQALPQPQREAFYQSLSDVLPPACGIEESVGSYKAYMDQQARGYYDRLGFNNVLVPPYEYSPYPVAHTPSVPGLSVLPAGPTPYYVPYPRALPPGSLPTPPQASVQRTPVSASNEFSNWLRFYGRAQAPSTAPSPSQTPSLTDSNTSTGSLLWPHEIIEGHTRHRSSSGSMPLEMSEILESPVLRSRQTTGDIKVSYEAPLADEEYFKKFFKSSPVRNAVSSDGQVKKDEDSATTGVVTPEKTE